MEKFMQLKARAATTVVPTYNLDESYLYILKRLCEYKHKFIK